jgi:hypothetical protein
MLSTVAVEVAQRRIPADGDTRARPVSGWSYRCPETLGVDVQLPRRAENAAGLPCPAARRNSERWS